MGRCSLLVGLRSSSQSLDQIALLLREFWRISWRFRVVKQLIGFRKELRIATTRLMIILYTQDPLQAVRDVVNKEL